MIRNPNATCGKVSNESLSCPYWTSTHGPFGECRKGQPRIGVNDETLWPSPAKDAWCGEHPDFEVKEKDMDLNTHCIQIHEWARGMGWHEKEREIGTLLALLHSEISEALEEFRKGRMETYEETDGKPCGYASELADVFIRLADTCAIQGIDLEVEVARKMSYNHTRPHRHGEKAC